MKSVHLFEDALRVRPDRGRRMLVDERDEALAVRRDAGRQPERSPFETLEHIGTSGGIGTSAKRPYGTSLCQWVSRN
jgi:hypothetical protein